MRDKDEMRTMCGYITPLSSLRLILLLFNELEHDNGDDNDNDDDGDGNIDDDRNDTTDDVGDVCVRTVSRLSSRVFFFARNNPVRNDDTDDADDIRAYPIPRLSSRRLFFAFDRFDNDNEPHLRSFIGGPPPVIGQ